VHLIRTALLFLAFAACTGGTTPDVEPPPEPAPEPAAEPEAAAPEDPTDAIQDYAEKLMMNLGELEEVTAPVFSEGDFERMTKGYRKGDEVLLIIDQHSVGEYGQTTMTYALKNGAVIEWTRSGFSHEPTSDNDIRFVYFDEEVVMEPDGSVLLSRRRQKDGQGSGLEMSLGDAEWTDIEPPTEHIDLADAMTRLSN